MAISLVASALAVIQAIAQLHMPFGALAWAGNYSYSPTDPLLRLETQLASGQEIGPQALEEAARASLLAAPLNSIAVRTFGIAADKRGRKNDARNLMILADRLSRRDGRAQLWLIGDAVANRNVDAVLRRYDSLLRTYPEAGIPLMRQLAMILNVPEARTAIRPYMNGNNPWRLQLLHTALSELPDSAPIGELVMRSPRLSNTAVHRQFASALVGRLARDGHFTLLQQLYPRLPGTNVHSLTSANWNRDSGEVNFEPVTWAMASSNDFGGALRPIGSGATSELEGFAMPLTGGVVATKLLWVRPGRVRLTWTISDHQENPNASANWVTRCATPSNGPLIAASENLFVASTENGLMFDVPANCQVILVQLKVSGGDGRDPSRIVIRRLILALDDAILR